MTEIQDAQAGQTRREQLSAEYGERVVNTLDKLVEFCDALGEIVTRGRDTVLHDRMTQWAAEMGLIRIGEAVNRLPASFLTDFAEQPWRRIIGMRNFTAHQYDDLNYEVIWNTLTSRVPALRQYIVESILDEHHDEAG